MPGVTSSQWPNDIGIIDNSGEIRPQIEASPGYFRARVACAGVEGAYRARPSRGAIKR